jgi:dolichol kinase
VIAILLTVILVATLLISSELWYRQRNPHGEFSRKFVHVTVGSFAAFWPFFMSWNSIRFLSIAFLVGVAASKYLNFFKVIHSVQRPTWGELFFAAVAGALTLVTHDKWVFAAALLQMSLADGFAAIVGVRAGKTNQYKVFGHIKSYAGSLTFFVFSIAILVSLSFFSDYHLSLIRIGTISALATIIENMGIRGSDNLLVPMLTAILIRAS